MVALAASDVTYAVVDQSVSSGSGYKSNSFDVTFGDGSLTYPTGGVGMAKAKFGCPNVIKKLNFSEPAAGNGYVYKYDLSAEKLVMYFADYDAGADGALIEVTTGIAPASAVLRIDVEGY